MSNELVKLEVDCAVAPYSHHHHHHHPHHLPPHQNPHLQHHHNPRLEHEHLEVASPPHATDERTSNEDEEGEYLDEVDEDEEELIEKEEQKVQFECNEGQIDGLTRLVKGIHSYAQENGTTNGNLGELTQLENVVNQTGLEHCKIASKDTHHAESVSPASSSNSSNSDISESEDDDDDEDEDADDDDDDSEEDEDSDAEEDDDESEDDDEFEEEIDDDDIVDPVGHQPNSLMQRTAVSTDGYDCNGTNMSCYNRIKNNHESTRDEDVSFDHEIDEQAQLHDFSSPILLDSERMLEVTRKLVRTTERDPDRDLRKQVLLRTAIRKLPQFMEYNNYSKSFDQSFQMHNNTMEPNNAPLTCMSPAQYYEHNHLSHQIDAQPKSYYHSVQPNAIQMSTTSLRMLDLNDDTESEQTITSLESNQHQDHGYGSHSDLGSGVNQSNLDQRQLEYASHQIYDQHYANLDTHPTSMNQEHNSQGAIHDFSQYDSNHDSSEAMISRHSTIENLYQPLESNDMSDDMKAIDQSAAFESVGDYSRVTSEFEVVSSEGPLDKSDINDNMINTSAQQIASVLNSEKDDSVTTSTLRDLTDDSYHQSHDCNQTDTTAFYDSNETQQDSLQLANLETPMPTSPSHESNETNLVGTIEDLEEDQSGCSEGGSSNSSQSSTTSDDSVNSSSSQSNDSAGHLSGISMLETSLNTSGDRFNYSHDSGVALFSPKSNKRSSSSIGLDDEMEIDHLTDLTSSNQFNSGGTVSTLNQCKRMRKREIMD